MSFERTGLTPSSDLHLFRTVLRRDQPLSTSADLLGQSGRSVQGQEEEGNASAHLCRHRRSLQEHVEGKRGSEHSLHVSHPDGGCVIAMFRGESGAGKTENTKKVIQYLAQVAGSRKTGVSLYD